MKTNAEIVAQGKQYVMNTYNRLPMALVEGKGVEVFDADGNRYLDFVAGVAVNSLGHCYPEVVEAIRDQADKMLHCSNLYWIEPQVELAKILVEHSCFDKVFFCNSGAEANEGAIKLARKYAKAKGHPERFEIISMVNSFHGRTLATLTATGQDKVHENFDPLPSGFKYISFNDVEAAAAAVDEHTAAFLVEPVQGEGGVLPADDDFLKELRRICDEHDLLLIFDEVQVGCGRTGKLFAYEWSSVEPDVMTLAKALAGGVAIGALLAKDEAAAFVPGEHASTFGGNALATAAGCAAMRAIIDKNIPDHVQEMSEYFSANLEKLKKTHPSLLQVRGKGLLLGVVADKPGAEVVAKCMEKGLLINCTAGTVFRFVPPLIVEKENIDEAIAIFDKALTECGF